MSERRARAIACFAAVLASAVVAGSATAGTARPGFQDEHFASVPTPVGLAYTPDGTLLVASLTGELTAVAADGSTRQIGDLSADVCLGRERGLYAIAVDPDFSDNRAIYLSYSRKRDGVGCDQQPYPDNRISRFTLAADLTLDPASEHVLIDGISSPEWIHNAGDLEFGKDGNLYVTTGDGGCEAPAAGCGGGNRAAAKRNDLRGKVLRITRDGDIPAGNPFTGPGTARCNAGPAPEGVACQEIWALGLRNPFRFAHDPDAPGVRLFINDVGLNHWEEVNDGRAGADYGWPTREGTCVRGSFTDCPPPGPGMTDPIYAYQHDNSGCTSITGGAFVPAAAWPPPWAGSYIFGDFACGRLFRLRRAGSAWTREDFLTDGNAPIDLIFGPAGSGRPALYYAELGGSVRRIRYTGSDNRAPSAALQVSDTRGALPLEVTFDAGGSSDPDGDAITYEFDFGDGSPKVTGSSPRITHTYTSKGHYTATVVVRDPAGETSSAEARIDAGFLPPQIEIVAPGPDHRFSVGEPLQLRAEASDPEDGELDGASISWRVLLHHADHTHPYAGPADGRTLEITGPAPETVAAAGNSYLDVYATATDRDGLTTTTYRRLDPRKIRVAVDANVPSAPITVNNTSLTTPTTMTSWAGWTLEVGAAPDHLLHTFRRWRDGERDNPRTLAPVTDTALIADYDLLGLYELLGINGPFDGLAPPAR